jgi:hypothetical protein
MALKRMDNVLIVADGLAEEARRHGAFQITGPGVRWIAMNNAKAHAKAKLAQVVRRVMADGRIDASEREEMQSIYREALLTVIDVKEVLTGYLGEVRDEVLADGKVTEEERARCRAALAELKLPRELVPPDFRALL